MSYVGRDFTDMDEGEEENFAFDFGPVLPAGVGVVAATWVSEVTGTEADASNVLIDLPVINGTVVSQKVAGLVAGVKYLQHCSITATDGTKPSLWSYVRCVDPATE